MLKMSWHLLVVSLLDYQSNLDLEKWLFMAAFSSKC